jgi:hypothetical protein
MRLKEIIREEGSCGTSSGSIATVNTPLGSNSPKDGQFFGGNPNSSIYTPIKKNRKKRKSVVK